MKILFMYDFTGIMAQPWLDAGHECWLVDGQHSPGITAEGNLIKLGWQIPTNYTEFKDMLCALIGNCDLVIGFPECTDLAVSGAAHFKSKRDRNPFFQYDAMQHFYLCREIADYFMCPYMIENPVSVASTIWRKPDFSFHPWEYGGYLPEDDQHPIYPDYTKARDAYPKKTCIWSGNGFNEPVKNPVQVDSGYSDQYKKLGGKSLKTKNIRSATPRGYARAVFEFNNNGATP